MPFRRLTERERQVAEEICRRNARGRFQTMEEVAKRLGMRTATAKSHLRTLALRLPNPHGLPAQRLVRSFESVMRSADSSKQKYG